MADERGHSLRLFAAAALLVFVAIADPAMAQQFSADLVSREAQVARPAKKIFVSGNKVRVETGDASGSILIADSGAGIAYMVMPRQQVYIETANPMAVEMARLFRPADPADPCTEWLKLVQVRGHGATCRRIGEDTIDGRHTIKFEGVSPEGEHGYAWVDPALHFVIRIEGPSGGGMALQNIKEAPQPVDLFGVPADFRKIEPQAMAQPGNSGARQ